MFGPPRVASFALAPSPTRSLALTATVTATAGSRLVTHVRFGSDGRTWGSWQPLPEPVADAVGVIVPPTFGLAMGTATPDGSRRLYAQVRDEGGTVSASRSATVVVDRTGPVLGSAPYLWYSATSLSWRARWNAAADPHGPIGYKVWQSVNGGPWTIVALRTSTRGVVLPVKSRSAHVAVRIRPIDGLGNWGSTRSVSH